MAAAQWSGVLHITKHSLWHFSNTNISNITNIDTIPATPPLPVYCSNRTTQRGWVEEMATGTGGAGRNRGDMRSLNKGKVKVHTNIHRLSLSVFHKISDEGALKAVWFSERTCYTCRQGLQPLRHIRDTARAAWEGQRDPQRRRNAPESCRSCLPQTVSTPYTMWVDDSTPLNRSNKKSGIILFIVWNIIHICSISFFPLIFLSILCLLLFFFIFLYDFCLCVIFTYNMKLVTTKIIKNTKYTQKRNLQMINNSCWPLSDLHRPYKARQGMFISFHTNMKINSWKMQKRDVKCAKNSLAVSKSAEGETATIPTTALLLPELPSAAPSCHLCRLPWRHRHAPVAGAGARVDCGTLPSGQDSSAAETQVSQMFALTSLLMTRTHLLKENKQRNKQKTWWNHSLTFIFRETFSLV